MQLARIALQPLIWAPKTGVVGSSGVELTGHQVNDREYAYIDLASRRCLVTTAPFAEDGESREVHERAPTESECASITMSNAPSTRGKVFASGAQIAQVATDASRSCDGRSLLAAVDARFSHNDPRVYVFDYSDPMLPQLPLVGVYDLAGNAGRLMRHLDDVVERTGPVTHDDVMEIEALLRRLPEAARYGVAMSIGRRLNAGARPITADVQEHLAEVEQSLSR